MFHANRLLNLLMAVVLFLVAVDETLAHALIAEFRVLPGQQVRVEAWFETDDPASGAKVQVFRPDKSLLIQGNLDDKGVFTFPFKDLEPLEVVISAGQGHGAKLSLTPEVLAKPSTETNPLRPGPSRDDTSPLVLERPPTPFPLRDVILGITFLLALAAFVMSLRNAQALKKPPQRPTTSP